MDDKGKQVSSINSKIAAGEAVVLTEGELRAAAGDGASGMPKADLVVVACRTGVSGAAAMMVVPVAERGVFTRADRIWLNGVPGCPGPAPNERLGLVDTQVFADQRGRDGDYHGADLLADIIAGKRIAVECLSVEGDTYHGSFTMDRLEFARMYVYNAFLPAPAADAVLSTIGAGSRILLNGAEGIVVGRGTRDAPDGRSLSLSAEMFEMDPLLLDAAGLSNSIALAIPVAGESALRALLAWSRDRDGSGGDAADRLKGLIERREFQLTVTDMGLGG